MNPAESLTEEQAAEDTLVALGNTDIVTTSWVPDGSGIVADGVVGGDGAYESVSIRYLNRYVPNGYVTAYFYVVDERDRRSPGDPELEAPFAVEQMVEFFLGDRPVADEGVDEVWTDYEYHTTSRFYADEAEAVTGRDLRAARDQGSFYPWDGTPT